jgi:diguanylate cyclase (GGDEF)-like protein
VPAESVQPIGPRGKQVLVVALSLFVLYVIWQVTRFGGAANATLISDSFSLPVGLLTVVTCTAASRRSRVDRALSRAWGFFAVAMCGYFAGNVLVLYQDATEHVSNAGAWSDLFFYAFLFAGIVRFGSSRRSSVRRWLFGFDTVILALSCSAVLWYLIAGPSASARGHSIPTVLYSIAYPIGDVLVLLAVVRTIELGVRTSSRRAVEAIALGMVVYLVSDTIIGYTGLHGGYGTSDHVGIIAMAAATVLAIAPVFQRAITSRDAVSMVAPPFARSVVGWISYAAAAAVFGLVFVIQRHLRFFPDLSVLGVAVLVGGLLAASGILGRRALLGEQARSHALAGELRQQAFYDNLTGLANRELFNERLEHALARRRSLSVSHAVVMVELDDFKSVNDSLGHGAGNALLQTIASRLSGAVRRGDTVARVGGDDFAILLEDVGGPQAAIEIVEFLLAAVHEPVEIAGRALSPAVSVGIALTEEEPRSGDDLLRFADTALYQAKTQAHRRYCLFETAMQTVIVERVELEADLRGAARRGELRVFYQPIVDLGSSELRGFEALVRWVHPTRGLLSPDAFIPLAERCGLVHEVDTWVLYTACAEARRWQQESSQLSEIAVHVNLSPMQLHEPDLLETIGDALSSTGLEARLLTLELVESSVVDDLELAQNRLTELKTLGVHIAVDDFGTGYSSLSHLRTLPIDELKIDKSFIAAMGTSIQANTLVHSLVQLGTALGISTVAEGIEDAEQLVRLEQEEGLQGQGYLFARPLDHDGLRAYLADQLSAMAKRPLVSS